jgi:hypothetical protein
MFIQQRLKVQIAIADAPKLKFKKKKIQMTRTPEEVQLMVDQSTAEIARTSCHTFFVNPIHNAVGAMNENLTSLNFLNSMYAKYPLPERLGPKLFQI